MRRGSIVIFRESGSPASKVRPCIVVQRDVSIADSTKITAVPLSSYLVGLPQERPVLLPTPANGLRKPSEAEVDWIFSFERARLGPTIGQVDEDVMKQIDIALRNWLDL